MAEDTGRVNGDSSQPRYRAQPLMHAKLPILRRSVRRLLDHSGDLEFEEAVDYDANTDRWSPTVHDFSMRR